MKRPVLPFFLALSFLGALSVRGQEADEKETSRRALALMEDVVLHPPFPEEIVKVWDKGSRAIWGPIFGDAQIGALVAVQPDESKEGSDADLCLLLWHDGWKFAQQVGKVSSGDDYREQWDWGIKRRTPHGPGYVIDCFDLNSLSNRKHFSWLCDPETHSLIPTGWPEDAMASISGTTIMFQRCEKSGYAPIVSEILQFDRAPGKLIASLSGDLYNRTPLTIRLLDPATGELVTWRILKAPPKYEPSHDRFSLCYSPADKASEPFHEDAMVDVQWKQGQYPTDAIGFLIWRLTGLERPAQLGWWDEDILREKDEHRDNSDLVNPGKVIVTGIPEAVKAFSWPPDPSDASP